MAMSYKIIVSEMAGYDIQEAAASASLQLVLCECRQSLQGDN